MIVRSKVYLVDVAFNRKAYLGTLVHELIARKYELRAFLINYQ